MVERFNCTLLQLLQSSVDKESDWEQYLPLVLYAYRTAIHFSTGCSPFQLMFGGTSSSSMFNPEMAYESSDYSYHIRSKLAESRDFVETNLPNHQKTAYEYQTSSRKFAVAYFFLYNSGN